MEEIVARPVLSPHGECEPARPPAADSVELLTTCQAKLHLRLDRMAADTWLFWFDCFRNGPALQKSKSWHCSDRLGSTGYFRDDHSTRHLSGRRRQISRHR